MAAPDFQTTTDEQGRQHLRLCGDWAGAAALPDLCGKLQGNTLIVDGRDLGHWDSRLASHLLSLHRQAEQQAATLQFERLPEGLQRLLDLATAVPPQPPGNVRQESFSATLQRLLQTPWQRSREFLQFFGDCLLALWQALRGRSQMRASDFFYWFEQASVRALPIVSLIALLVGMILAYLGSVQLRQFGAQVYVANLVGIGMTREMGALMIAILMAGRTGAAYAAQLGAMQANDEIDALRTLGIPPMEFLVLPRLLATMLALPLLTLYADVLGMIGGALVTVGMGVSPLQYFTQTQDAIGFTQIAVGVGKSLVFAFLIALAGCRHGLQSGRSSTAVGQATTAAVVSAIISIVVADSIMNVLLDRLEI